MELGPDPVLTALVQQTHPDAVAVATLRATLPEADTVLESVVRAYIRGVTVDWGKTADPVRAGSVALPTYAFEPTSFWLADTRTSASEQTGDAEFWQAVADDGVAALLAVAPDAPLASVTPALAAWHARRTERTAIDRWRYRVAWRRLELPAGAVLAGMWLLVVPESRAEQEWAAQVERALAERGADVKRLTVDTAEADRAWFADRLSELMSEPNRFEGMLSLLPADDAPHPSYPAVPGGAAATSALVQGMLDAKVGVRLWTVTRAALAAAWDDRPAGGTDLPAGSVDLPANDTDLSADPAQAQTWGMGRAIALEHPALWAGLIDLPETVGAADRDRLADVLSASGDEDQIAIRDGQTAGRRLVRAPLHERTPSRTWQPRGTVLITGGTGGIGAEAARWFARRGAEHLLLASRRGPDAPGARDLCAELEASGVAVTIEACDMAVREDVAALLATVPAQWPLTAVVHAAGVPQRLTPVSEIGLDDYADVVSGKVEGARHLDDLLGDTPLDAFVLFSSNAATWGSGSMGAYAAGNASLDALAERRRAAGRTATSIAWGAWSGGGMGVVDGAGDYMERRGVLRMAPETALAAMSAAVERDEAAVAVADVDWERFVPGFTSGRPSPLLSEVPEACRATESGPGSDAASADGNRATQTRALLTERLTALDERARSAFLVDLVRGEAAAVLRHRDAGGIAADRAFKELGFDSLTAVELRHRVNARSGLDLPTSLVFDHPTPSAVAEAVLAGLGLEAAGSADAAEAAERELAALERRISELAPGAESAAPLAERLEALARRLRADAGRDRAAEGDGDSGTDPDGGLLTASAEEMFALIDRELGDPRGQLDTFSTAHGE